MNIHIVIKKYTLSEFAGVDYWQNFGLLIGLPLSDDQFLKLINFYSAAESYKAWVLSAMSKSDGYGYRFASTPDSLTVYSHFGVLNPHSISEVIKTGPEFSELASCRRSLFDELGWAEFEEKIGVVETEFNEEDNFRFTVESTSYEELESLYNSSQSLESFLGN
jgi:hypothetical protein